MNGNSGFLAFGIYHCAISNIGFNRLLKDNDRYRSANTRALASQPQRTGENIHTGLFINANPHAAACINSRQSADISPDGKIIFMRIGRACDARSNGGAGCAGRYSQNLLRSYGPYNNIPRNAQINVVTQIGFGLFCYIGHICCSADPSPFDGNPQRTSADVEVGIVRCKDTNALVGADLEGEIRFGRRAACEVVYAAPRVGVGARVRELDQVRIVFIHDYIIGGAIRQADIRAAVLMIDHRVAGFETVVGSQINGLICIVNCGGCVKTYLVGVCRVDDGACPDVSCRGLVQHCHRRRSCDPGMCSACASEGNRSDIFKRNRHHGQACDAGRLEISVAIFIAGIDINGRLIAAGVQTGVAVHIGFDDVLRAYH